LAQTFTNDELLENIRLRAMMPESQTLYTDERLLMLANDELQTVIFPMIMSIKGDYFVAKDTQTMTTTLEYDLPGDAVGIKVKDCYWRNPNWPARQPSQLIPLINYQDYTNQAAGLFNYMAYYIMGNKVHLTNVRQGQYLEILYYKRASKLVPNDECAQIVDASTANIELTNIPSGWAVGDLVSVIDENPPFNTLATGIEIVTISPPIVTLLNSGDPITLEEGQWLALDGETPIAQITPEAHPILSQAVAVKCLEALNDPNLLSSQAKFQQLYDAFINAMTPRTDGQAKKIIQRNGTLFWNKVGRGSWIGGR
jgi:hypothetical protein